MLDVENARHDAPPIDENLMVRRFVPEVGLTYMFLKHTRSLCDCVNVLQGEWASMHTV